MRPGMNKAVFFLMILFLTGCGREEIVMENERDVSAETENNDEKDISKEADVQYPLIAVPSDTKRIDFVIVSEEKYCIFDGEKYGFIAEDGEEIAPCIYDVAYPFSEGLACVCIDGKYGYLDSEGETAISFDFDRAAPFAEGLAYFSIGDTYGFMDKTGTQVLSFVCDSVSSFQEGLAFFSIDGRYGYIDQSGQIVLEPVFDDAGYFKEGLAKVMKNGRYGIINRDGTFIVVPEYDTIAIDGPFIIAQSEGNYTCFDRAGKVLLEQSDYILPAGGEYACFTREGKEGLIDEEGNILIEPLYDWISLQTPERNLAIVEEENLYGIVDLQGEVRIPAAYSQIAYDSYVDSAAGGMFLLTDADGNMESVDGVDFSEKMLCSYDSINWISQDWAVVSQDGLSGIIDREGNLIEPIEYDVIRFFTDGAVWMKKGEEAWFYNSSGEAAEGRFDYDNILWRGNCYQTEKDGKYGFLNEHGEKVIAPVYDYISNYEICGCFSNIYVSTNYSGDIRDSVIKTGEPVRTDDLSEALLQNEITPRIGMYQEFTQSGSISYEDMRPDVHTIEQEALRRYKKTYKLYDLNHSGKPILYFKAEPYEYNNFPESYSGFYAIMDNQLVELFTGNECGGSWRGDRVCLWYDKETSRVLPGTIGVNGGFGGYSYHRAVYDWKDGEMTRIASYGWMAQPISYYSEEELEHAELVYGQEGMPYTKEMIEQAEQEEIVQVYSVNGVQTTIETYQEMKDRYWVLFE